MRADEAVLMRSVYCAHTCIGVLAWRSTHKGEEEVAGHAVSRFRDLEKSRSAIRVLLDLGGDGCLRVGSAAGSRRTLFSAVVRRLTKKPIWMVPPTPYHHAALRPDWYVAALLWSKVALHVHAETCAKSVRPAYIQCLRALCRHLCQVDTGRGQYLQVESREFV
jgi:hypothetical protein